MTKDNTTFTTFDRSATAEFTISDYGGNLLELCLDEKDDWPINICIQGPITNLHQSYSMDIEEAQRLFIVLGESLKKCYKNRIHVLYKTLEDEALYAAGLEAHDE